MRKLAATLALSLAACPALAECIAQPFVDWSGKDKMLVGVMPAPAEGPVPAPFTLRYAYLVPGWQGWKQPAGEFVRDVVRQAESAGQVPMFTWYVLLQASRVPEGAALVGKLADRSFMPGYYDGFKTALQAIGEHKAIVHIEPDVLGQALYVNRNPGKIPAAVKVNPDCTELADTITGWSACMVKMVHKYAPKALAGVHATMWNAGLNRDPGFDVAGDARSVAQFISGSGADLLVVEADDRDAGYYTTQNKNRWWNLDGKLPNFDQALLWTKTVTEAAGKPAIIWQIPLGNKDTRLKDNRVEGFFGMLPAVQRANVVALAFGSGSSTTSPPQTDPNTDGGYLVRTLKAADLPELCAETTPPPTDPDPLTELCAAARRWCPAQP